MTTIATSAPPARAGHPAARPVGRLGLRELWEYRELLYFLTKRELQIRYKQSLLGVAWAVLQPLALAFIFALFFGRLADVPSDGLPYPVFALAGLVPWMFVSQARRPGRGSLVGDANLLSKVYFPRLVIPSAKLAALLLDLLSSPWSCSCCSSPLYGVDVAAGIVARPAFLPARRRRRPSGPASRLAALNVRYRDVTVAIPLADPALAVRHAGRLPGLARSPATGSTSTRSTRWSTVIDGLRWALLGTRAPKPGVVAVSVAVGAGRARRRGRRTSGGPSASSRTSSDASATSRSAPRASGKRYQLGQLARRLRAAHARRSCERAPRVGAPQRAARGVLGAARRRLRGRSAARRSASSATTAPARARCSRCSPASRRPRPARSGCAAASARCSRSAPASTPSSPGRENVFLNGAILGMRRARDRAEVRRDRRVRRGRARSSTRRSSATRAACTCGSRSRSPPTSSPRSCSSTRSWRSATSPSRRSAWAGWRRSPARAARCCS